MNDQAPDQDDIETIDEEDEGTCLNCGADIGLDDFFESDRFCRESCEKDYYFVEPSE